MSDHRAGVPIEKAEAVVVLGHDDGPARVPASLWWRAFPEVGQPLLGSGVPGGGAGRPIAMRTEEAQPSQGVKGGRAIPGGSGLDFTLYADVQPRTLTIMCGVCNAQSPSWTCAASPVAQQFPVGTGPKPTSAERDRVVAWLDAGAPQ